MRKHNDYLRGTSNSCSSGKRAHVTRRDAKAHVRSLEGVTGEHLRPYTCGECGFWHVGHLPGKVIRGRTSASAHYRGKAS